MSRLFYLRERHVRFILSTAREIYPDPHAFEIDGPEGRNRLLSAIEVPRQPNHRTLQQKAAALLFHVSENHPLNNGNKRFAATAMLVFFGFNGAGFWVTEEKLEEVSLAVAKGEMSRNELARFVTRRTVRGKWDEEQFYRWFDRLSEHDDQDVFKAVDILAAGGSTISSTVNKAFLRHFAGVQQRSE